MIQRSQAPCWLISLCGDRFPHNVTVEEEDDEGGQKIVQDAERRFNVEGIHGVPPAQDIHADHLGQAVQEEKNAGHVQAPPRHDELHVKRKMRYQPANEQQHEREVDAELVERVHERAQEPEGRKVQPGSVLVRFQRFLRAAEDVGQVEEELAHDQHLEEKDRRVEWTFVHQPDPQRQQVSDHAHGADGDHDCHGDRVPRLQKRREGSDSGVVRRSDVRHLICRFSVARLLSILFSFFFFFLSAGLDLIPSFDSGVVRCSDFRHLICRFSVARLLNILCSFVLFWGFFYVVVVVFPAGLDLIPSTVVF